MKITEYNCNNDNSRIAISKKKNMRLKTIQPVNFKEGEHISIANRLYLPTD